MVLVDDRDGEDGEDLVHVDTLPLVPSPGPYRVGWYSRMLVGRRQRVSDPFLNVRIPASDLQNPSGGDVSARMPAPSAIQLCTLMPNAAVESS
jgi:hypothetical protein